MDWSGAKRQPFMGNRVIRDGSVTMEKLADDVREKVENGGGGSGIELVTQAEYNAIQSPDPDKYYAIYE